MSEPTMEQVDVLTGSGWQALKVWRILDERGVPYLRDQRKDAEPLFNEAMARYRKGVTLAAR